MSQIVVETSTSSTTEAQEPFYYGWRYVRRRYPNGREVVEQVPLTREDVLYPQEGDFVIQNDNHIGCYTAGGEYIEDYAGIYSARVQLEARFKQAEARATAEQQARADAEARVAALEAELRRLRGEG